MKKHTSKYELVEANYCSVGHEIVLFIVLSSKEKNKEQNFLLRFSDKNVHQLITHNTHNKSLSRV